MHRNDLFSGLAAVLAAIALVIALSSGRDTDVAAHSDELRAMVEASSVELRAELVERLDGIITELGLAESNPVEDADLQEIAALAQSDPYMAHLLREGIESVILKQMADELAAVDWAGVASSEEIQKLLRKAARASSPTGFSRFQAAIDVSDIADTEGKIDRILEEFEGVNFYTHDNALVKQLAEMGDAAIEPLLAQLDGSNFGQDHIKRMAVTDALNELLTEEHEDIIIEQFTKTGQFSELIEKYQFPAAEEEVMNKIAYPAHGQVNKNVVDAALKMDSERSIPLLLDYVGNGQNVAYAAGQLAAEGVDIEDPLRKATTRVNNTWEKAQLTELCLERDMPEGYDLAIEVLRSNEEHANHWQEQVYQYVRKYTGLNGSYDEVADWLQENRPD